MALNGRDFDNLPEIGESARKSSSELWPFWSRIYAQGDPLPDLKCTTDRPQYSFDEGEELPQEYRLLLMKMLRHEGERAGNKSFLGLMGTCLELAEAQAPTEEARLLKAEYVAEELKHAIMFHRLTLGLDESFALQDVPYAHYAFHLPKETWADDAFFHFFIDLNGAFHARDWRDSSYIPLRKISRTIERDEFGHSEMGYYFLQELCSGTKGRILVQHLLPKWYSAALDMFGRSDSPNTPKFINWGLKGVGNAEIRQKYKAYVDSKIVALGLDLPDERHGRRFI
ncbi:MAG: phenylacetate-CoA oxygenase subunit PaaI [Deltaproteobacteria bacterium]|nr:phenylacetate-CoA oxygenase subunit PaaI [Deltaproteobacteria bacterium]